MKDTETVTLDDILDNHEYEVRQLNLNDFNGIAKVRENTEAAIIKLFEQVIGEDIPQYFENPKNRTSKGIWYEAQQALVNEQRQRLQALSNSGNTLDE